MTDKLGITDVRLGLMDGYLEESPIKSMPKEHMERYIKEKGSEYLILNIMEETGELNQAVSKLRRAELDKKDMTDEMKRHLAEEAAHVWMALQNILSRYEVTAEMVNTEILKSLMKYYDGRM